MPEWVVQLIQTAMLGLALLAAMKGFSQSIKKPAKEQALEIAEIKKVIKDTQGNTYQIMCHLLNQAYDYWTRKQYCPRDEKIRLQEMFREYSGEDEFGKPLRNHVVCSFVKDIMDLPECRPAPQKRQVQGVESQ